MMCNKEIVSIIIPIYNVEKYIEQCLYSIVKQTYRNFEVIIIDDGSNDKSLEIARKIIENCKDIKFILIKQKNQGVSIARNNALKKANGEYILFVDPDDYLEYRCIEVLVKKSKQTNADIVLYNYRKVVEFENNRIFSMRFNLDKNKIYNGKQIAEMMLEGKMDGYLWNKLFKKNNLINNEFIFEINRYVQDWFPVFKEIYNSKRIVFTEDELYYYRQRLTSTVYSKSEKLLQDYYHAANKILNYSCDNGLSQRKINNFRIRVFSVIIQKYYELFSKNKNIYKNFKRDGYNNIFNNKFSSLLFSKDINIKVKFQIIFWKFKIYRIYKKLI